MPSHSKVGTKNKTPDHTVPSILPQTGSMSSAHSVPPVQGASPGPLLLGLSRAPHGQQGLCGHSEIWRQVTPPLPHLEALPVVRAWPRHVEEFDCDSEMFCGQRALAVLWDCGANLSLRRLQSTSEIPPFR